MKTKFATSADGTFHKSLKGVLIDYIKTSIPINAARYCLIKIHWRDKLSYIDHLSFMVAL